MIGPRGLRSVVAHRFAARVLVLWAGLRKSTKLNLDGEKNPSGHLQNGAGDARMQVQGRNQRRVVFTFSMRTFKVFIPILRARSEVFPHRDDLPVRILPLETDFLKTFECIS
jgi:hypothetical protein